MSFLSTLVAFLVALGVLIMFHELGHYWVARLLRVKILRFSIGFGKPLFSRCFGSDRTEWVIAALPLGGYVKMLDEREGPVAQEELGRAFNRQTVWRRFAIVSAGPIANFALAVLIYWLLLLSGVPETKPIIAAPQPGSIAEASGLQAGETISRLNGQVVTSWQELRWQLLKLIVDRQAARLEVINARNEINWRTLDFAVFDNQELEGDVLARTGLRLYRPPIEPIIDSVLAGSVAERVGLKSGDRVLSLDGRPIVTWDDLVAAVRAHPGTTLVLRVSSVEGERELHLQPEVVQQGGQRYGRIGAAPRFDPTAMRDMVVTVRRGPVEALPLAFARTWDTALFSLKMLSKMVTGQVSWKNLSGPVTIADYAGQSAQLGLAAYLGFLALISISLGVLNLLPIPLLDGGHLMYYVVEIFKGSPVSDRVMELGQRVGLSLLLFLMVFAFYNDINRLLSS